MTSEEQEINKKIYEMQKAWGSQGGKKTVALHGKAHFARIGKKGGITKQMNKKK